MHKEYNQWWYLACSWTGPCFEKIALIFTVADCSHNREKWISVFWLDLWPNSYFWCRVHSAKNLMHMLMKYFSGSICTINTFHMALYKALCYFSKSQATKPDPKKLKLWIRFFNILWLWNAGLEYICFINLWLWSQLGKHWKDRQNLMGEKKDPFHKGLLLPLSKQTEESSFSFYSTLGSYFEPWICNLT